MALRTILPFTLSHPAAVLPLRRKLVFSALVIGSMSPDFDYFFWPSANVRLTHTVLGIFLFCLPLGLMVLWLFHSLFKIPLLALAPVSQQRKLAVFARPFPFGPWRRFGLIVLSLIVGSATHLLWDSFTHRTMWPVQHLAWLQHIVFNIPSRPIRVYNLLQQVSTVFGLVALGVVYFRWTRHAPSQPLPASFQISRATKVAWTLSLLAIASLLCLVYSYFYVQSGQAKHHYEEVHIVVVAFMVSVFWELLLFSAGWKWARGSS